MDDLFSQDYDLNELHLITPAGREFQMLITPRFIGHYGNNVYEEYSSSLLSFLVMVAAAVGMAQCHRFREVRSLVS